MLAYRSRMQSALDGLAPTPMQPDWRPNKRTILQNNIAFLDDCIAKGIITVAMLEAFGKKQAPFLALNVAWAAQTQVGHWMTVLADWKTQLGADWTKPMPQATLSMWRARTTSCSACSRSSSVQTQSITACF